MRERTVGECKACGGRVVQHQVQFIVGPMMPPKCRGCGRTPESHLPELDMNNDPSGIDGEVELDE